MMYRELLHIYGPISINSFGLMIIIGLMVFWYCLQKDSRRPSLMSDSFLLDIMLLGTLVAVLGARIICMLSNWPGVDHWTYLFKFWEGGFSVLGAIISLAIFLPYYVRRHNLLVAPSLDLFALYGPLLQSIAKLGCFFAGCCYGKVTSVPWAITYTDTQSIAPLHQALHPTQLYSSLLLLCIFTFLYTKAQHLCKKPGQLFYLYLMLAGTERLVVDFFRDDQEFFVHGPLKGVSIYQGIAWLVIMYAVIKFVALSVRTAATSDLHEPL